MKYERSRGGGGNRDQPRQAQLITLEYAGSSVARNGPPWGVCIVYMLRAISLRAAFVPLIPDIIFMGQCRIKDICPVYRPPGSGNQKRVGAARDLPAPRQRFPSIDRAFGV